MSENSFGDVFSDSPLENHVDDYNKKMANVKQGNYPVYLALKPGEEALLRFIDKEPIKFWQHRVFDNSIKNGAGGYRVFSCTRTADCPLCNAGDKPTFKVAWQVLHMDALDEHGNILPRVKLWVQGIRFGELYERKSTKFDPSKVNVILERIGSGQNTQYSLDKADDTTEPKGKKEEMISLTDYFGLDDEKFRDMQRISSGMQGGGATPSSQPKDEYTGPKKGNTSLLEGDDDIPF